MNPYKEILPEALVALTDGSELLYELQSLVSYDSTLERVISLLNTTKRELLNLMDEVNGA